jgi:hypothetical protein
LSAVRDCLFNVFAATLHNCRQFLHPQPEEAPCHGDRHPFNTVASVTAYSFLGMHGIVVHLPSSKFIIGSNEETTIDKLIIMKKVLGALRLVSCGGSTQLLLHYKLVGSSVHLPHECSSKEWKAPVRLTTMPLQ